MNSILAKNVLFACAILVGLLLVTTGLLSSNQVSNRRVRTVSTSVPSFSETIKKVDSEFQASWKEGNLEHSKRADELIIARRIALALTGTIPSLEEIRLIEQQPKEKRIDWWLSYLLKDARYNDYFAERLARAYVGVENGPFLLYRRRRFVTWLSEQLKANRPYDEIVRQLITANGLWTDAPEVNFVTVTVSDDNNGHPDPIRLAAKTSRAFLGMRIDCLQCHDDMLGSIYLGDKDDSHNGMQKDFHQLAAFYTEVRTTLGGMRDQRFRHYKYKYLDEEKDEIVPPKVPFAENLLPESGNRREKLAGWVTHPENRPFARATVNRIWALMFGKPLVDPIDDIPLYGKYPPGMETLADDLIKHKFDIQRLIRLIANSRAFQADSRAIFEVTEKHENHFAVFPMTRLRPEQVAGSIIQASSLSTIDNSSHIIQQMTRFGQQTDFINRFGDTGEDEFDEQGGTIPQRLLLMNGNLVGERTAANPILLSAPAQIAVLAPDDEKALETTYLVLLSRLPSHEESLAFMTEFKAAKGDKRLRLLEDMFWLLINSSEFSWSH